MQVIKPLIGVTVCDKVIRLRENYKLTITSEAMTRERKCSSVNFLHYLKVCSPYHCEGIPVPNRCIDYNSVGKFANLAGLRETS